MTRKAQTLENETPETDAPETPETDAPETPENDAPETPENDPLDLLSTPEEMDEPATVREIDPRIKAFVDNGLARTIAAPRKWSAVRLPESEVKRVTRDAKRYARANGMTFRVKNTGDPTRIVYRVTPKVAAESASAEAS